MASPVKDCSGVGCVRARTARMHGSGSEAHILVRTHGASQGHSSYWLRDRRPQSDVPPLTSLRGGLQSVGWNILGAPMMGGCQHGLTVAAQGTEDGVEGGAGVVSGGS
jgi:hypothetical protein